jgi:hypothetical protein
LAGFLSGQGAVWVATHHAAFDDAACAAIDGQQFVAPHVEAAADAAGRFEESTPQTPVEHCAICHMQRVVGNARLARVIATHAAPRVVSAPVEAALATSIVVVPGFAPRGPPTHLA